MNIICEGLTLCQRVMEDKQTGLLTLVDWLERLESPVFPDTHHGFAFSARFRTDNPSGPDEPQPCAIRVMRDDDDDTSELVWQADATWAPGTQRLRAYQNFGLLRLKRAGCVRFRVEIRLGGGAWQPGATAYIDVVEKTLTANEVEAMRAAYSRVGLPIPGWVAERAHDAPWGSAAADEL